MVSFLHRYHCRHDSWSLTPVCEVSRECAAPESWGRVASAGRQGGESRECSPREVKIDMSPISPFFPLLPSVLLALSPKEGGDCVCTWCNSACLGSRSCFLFARHLCYCAALLRCHWPRPLPCRQGYFAFTRCRSCLCCIVSSPLANLLDFLYLTCAAKPQISTYPLVVKYYL